MKTFEVKTVQDWQAVAEVIAPLLVPGTVLTLSGPLGAGKTTFVQFLAHALGSTVEPKSPTFALMRSYPLRSKSLKRLLHIDAYRLENSEDAAPLALEEEIAAPGTIAVIEWPEQMEVWLGHYEKVRKRLSIEIRPDGSRHVSFV